MGDSFSFYYPDDHNGVNEARVKAENRRIVLEGFRRALGRKYPARWVDDRTSKGDFSGRDMAVDVFNVPVEMQRKLLRRLEKVRDRAKGHVGSRCMFIFHTPKATKEHYSDLVRELQETRVL